jgi:hypothetical protein
MRSRGRRGRLGRRTNPVPVRRAAEARVAGLVGRDGRDRRGRREEPREGRAVGGSGVGPTRQRMTWWWCLWRRRREEAAETAARAQPPHQAGEWASCSCSRQASRLRQPRSLWRGSKWGGTQRAGGRPVPQEPGGRFISLDGLGHGP